MNILITGGAGFIGSALSRYIINNTDYNICIVDKLSYASSLDSLKEISHSNRYIFERVDICNKVELKNVFDIFMPNIVMHLAAESHVDRSIENPEYFIETNIVGTFNILEVARDYWESLTIPERKKFKFHHISTDEVFGDLEESNSFFTEETPYAPSSPYSASKAASDHLVRSWFRTYSLPTIITNCSNNYGPYQFPEKLIPLVILNALAGKDIPIYGSGNQVRDWLYVEDHAEALLLVAIRGVIGETYNIGGHNEVRNIDVAKTICDILDELVPLNNGTYNSQIVHVKDRAGHDYRYAIDASKIANNLGWRPNEDFKSGIFKTVKWYIENESWCDNVKNN